MKRIFIGFIVFLNILVMHGQNFNWKAPLDSIHVEGYYKIPVSPDLLAELKHDQSDIRLFDKHHHVIPFMLFAEKPETITAFVHTFPILENAYIPSQSISRIIVHNPGKKRLSGFNMVVRNTSLDKEITLKGSDNQKDWFIIQREKPVRYPSNTRETTEIRKLEFPESDYEYFELTMNEKKRDPIHIISIGSMEAHVETGRYTQISAFKVSMPESKEKGKNQLILTFEKPYEISMLEVEVATAGLYFRQANIDMEVIRNNQPQNVFLSSFEISSGKSSSVRIEPIHTKKLIITISNGDNNPLQISKIHVYQLSHYLVASLKPAMSYELFFGDKQLESPEFDITHFTDSIPALLPEVVIKQWVRLPKQPLAKKSIFVSSVFLWVVMSLVIMILAFYSVRMLREMS